MNLVQKITSKSDETPQSFLAESKGKKVILQKTTEHPGLNSSSHMETTPSPSTPAPRSSFGNLRFFADVNKIVAPLRKSA
ncbi:MAG: hypothetical protein U1F57_09360 [bacterium]